MISSTDYFSFFPSHPLLFPHFLHKSKKKMSTLRASPRISRSERSPRSARTVERAAQSLLHQVLDPQIRMNVNVASGSHVSDYSANGTLVEMAKAREFARQQEKDTPRTNLRRMAAMEGIKKVTRVEAFDRAGLELSTTTRTLRSLPSRIQNVRDDSNPLFHAFAG